MKLLNNQIQNRPCDQTWGYISINIMDQAIYQGTDPVWEQVWERVRDKIWDQVQDPVKIQLDEIT